jgi:Uma2 family endonuclease
MTRMLRQGRLLTLDEFLALPEDNGQRYELEKGILVASPRPVPPRQRVGNRLTHILDEQMPPEWEAFTELEVVVSDREPATVRVPDVVVIPPNWVHSQVPAAKVLIAVEVTSPRSRRKATRVKPMKYAEAGIPHYWVIDLAPPATLTAHVLVDGRYQETQTVTGEFTTLDPFPLQINVPALITPHGSEPLATMISSATTPLGSNQI